MSSYQGKFLPETSAAPSARPGYVLFLLWISLAVPELVLHCVTSVNFSTMMNAGMVLPALFALVPALILCALICLIPRKWLNLTIMLIYSFLCLVFCGSQLVYYEIFGCFYSAFSLSNGGQVLQFWKIALLNTAKNILPLLLMAIPFVFQCIWGRRFAPAAAIRRKLLALLPVGGAVVLHLLVVLALPLGGTGDMSAYDLYHTNTDAYWSVNRLGLATALRLDVQRLAAGNQPSGSIQLEEETTPPQTSVPETTAATEATEEATEASTAPTIDTSPNVLDLDFDTLIAQSDNSDVTDVHKFFKARTPSRKNEKTGLFEGSNLVLITAEAFHAGVVTEERTPTLYKMMHEGFKFTEYYVPDWGTSTTDGEYSFLTGTVPKANVWSFYRSIGHAMPLTMVQQLKKQGYCAYAYHGHTYDYYYRNEYLENLGYIYRAYGQGLDIDYTWPESDIQVVDQTTGDYAAKEPFTAYYMTISGHREFNFTGNYIAAKNQDLVRDEPYSTNVRAYIATQLELDRSLALLVERLKEAGTYENTVFVLTPDHYPNGLTPEEIEELIGHPLEDPMQIYRNGCIIYKPGMTPETVSTPCSHLDLLPTLSNLFGLEFDSRLYMGRDVFSDAPAFVMFRDRSWITDDASYHFSSGTLTPRTEAPLPEDYADRWQKELSNRFAVSSRILDYDYWKILFPEDNQ